jgi:hypothetical protein
MIDAKDNRFYRDASRNDGLMQLDTLDDCDRGRHALQPRYDVHRVGDVFLKKYVCEVCARCGHVVERPMSVKEKLEAGLLSIEDAKVYLDAQFCQALQEAFPLREALNPGYPAQTPAVVPDAPAGSSGAPVAIADDDLPF